MKRRGESRRIGSRGVGVVRRVQEPRIMEEAHAAISTQNPYPTERKHRGYTVSLVEMQETRSLARHHRDFGRYALDMAIHHLYSNFPREMWVPTEVEVAGWRAIRSRGRTAIAAYFTPDSTEQLSSEREAVARTLHDMVYEGNNREFCMEDIQLRENKRIHLTAGYVPWHMAQQELTPIVEAAREQIPGGTVIELQKPEVI